MESPQSAPKLRLLGFDVDERLTTTEAHRYLHAFGVAGSDYKKVVDQVAALLILQGYLDEMANRAEDKRTKIGEQELTQFKLQP